MKNSLRLLITTMMFSLFLAGTAFAMDLTTAKKSGLVGELPNGMIAAVLPNPSPDLAALVATVNQGRLDVYKESAAKQNIPLTEVQKIAAQKIYDLAGPGEFIQINGRWVKK